MSKNEAKYQNAEWLRKKYWKEGLHTRDMAEIAGCGKTAILYWMRKYGIERRDHGKTWYEAYKNRQWLVDRYWGDNLTLSGMAQLARCTKRTILDWMERYQIERRQQTDINAQKSGGATYRNPEWLSQRYTQESKGIDEIAEEAGVNRATIHRWLIRHGIERRSIADAMRLAWTNGRHPGTGTIHRPTKPHRKVIAALEIMGIEHETEYQIPGDSHFYDEFIPAANLLIEVDGWYFHHSEWAQAQGYPKRDRLKEEIAQKNGYHLLRITDRQIEKHGAWSIVANEIYALMGGS